MDEERRSNRPTPRTPAAIEAELRRRIRLELAQARTDADGDLDDATLAEIIARAVASALSWHLEAPEHTRNATLSSRTWRPAGGPRGGPPPQGDFDEGPRRQFPPQRPDYGPPRPPRYPQYDEPYREDDYGPPRPRGGPGGRPPSGPRPGRRPPPGRGGGGGFGPRKPRRNG
ncbi:MAG TPA: hypothetical protein VGL99_10830 [Chloroflexota bacterium]